MNLDLPDIQECDVQSVRFMSYVRVSEIQTETLQVHEDRQNRISLIERDERSRPTSQNISTVLTNKCTQLPCDNCVHMLVKIVDNELYNVRNEKYKGR
jgi:hypothetical protein